MPWEIVTNNSEILAIHAALLPTNQVLMFGGSEHNAVQNRSGNAADLDNTRLFNLAGGPLIETIGSPDTDVFCSGHACLSDGRLLVGGGTKEWGGDHDGHGHRADGLQRAVIQCPSVARHDGTEYDIIRMCCLTY